ncbi:hypothetical protein C8T65DRAFT_211781 [Cerioporus squamosus]|nr:hypothetical protein C8T65DRAFT_211781 [Cerioporus squamosus]
MLSSVRKRSLLGLRRNVVGRATDCRYCSVIDAVSIDHATSIFPIVPTLTHPLQVFILPGSHGVVYPWSPPLFGIPSDVLRALRDELKSMLVQWAIAQVDRTDTSTQSSPRSEPELPASRAPFQAEELTWTY